ncbi:hypothetical protein, partial [Acidisphaera sp. L21]|uniref:hypothetical protein n=1 Tax=Acidisphaera sp. L21 TaxID=1641851 RepID=UPI00131CB2D4
FRPGVQGDDLLDNLYGQDLGPFGVVFGFHFDHPVRQQLPVDAVSEQQGAGDGGEDDDVLISPSCTRDNSDLHVLNQLLLYRGEVGRLAVQTIHLDSSG